MQITLLKTWQLKVPSYSIFQHFVCEWGQRLAEMIRKNMTDLYIQRATIKIWSKLSKLMCGKSSISIMTFHCLPGSFETKSPVSYPHTFLFLLWNKLAWTLYSHQTKLPRVGIGLGCCFGLATFIFLKLENVTFEVKRRRFGVYRKLDIHGSTVCFTYSL